MSDMKSAMDSLVLAALLGSLGEKGKISPFTVSINLTPVGVESHSQANRKLIEKLHAEKWLEETNEKISPIITEQTKKFVKLLKEEFGFEEEEAEVEKKEKEPAKEQDISDLFVEFLDGLIKGFGEHK